jgi:SAM-dependent methyltransferase
LLDTPPVANESSPSAKYFDDWYANMPANPLKDEIQQRHLGLPPGFLSTSAFPWEGLAVAVEELRPPQGGTLIDLACGRGAYGIEIASRAGAALIGVDFSAEAVRQARDRAALLGVVAEFRVGELEATGLEQGCADAVLCIDSIQFATHPPAAYAEIRRILAPGGRVMVTSWEPVDRNSDRLPDRLRGVDLEAGLTGAGFTEVVVVERRDWRARERDMWEEAAALDPGRDPALRSFHDEGVRSLAVWDLLRRVTATASAL